MDTAASANTATSDISTARTIPGIPANLTFVFGNNDKIIEGGSVKVTATDLYLLGIAIVIGGQYFGWNPGLESVYDDICMRFYHKYFPFIFSF
jgi:hypothetical protein